VKSAVFFCKISVFFLLLDALYDSFVRGFLVCADEKTRLSLLMTISLTPPEILDGFEEVLFAFEDLFKGCFI
jgi:hypothetical protein